MPQRQQQLENWLKQTLDKPFSSIEPASSDASFRRYFRVMLAEGPFIVMDAPPDKEDCHPYVEVANMLQALGLNVPEVLATDFDQGFLLLTDLGTSLYLDALSEDTVERLYGDALGALMSLQACGPDNTAHLPPYDRALLQSEMQLFTDWYLDKHLGITADDAMREVLACVHELCIASALEQPQVCVHRDYHSRNLMVLEDHNPGILDFQDAVVGPMTYDLVSLLRDCYISWPRARVEEWALGFHELALHSGVLREENEARFLRWFDLMGVQRHLKAIGIFARLNYRDNKPDYLADIPRTLGYVLDVCERYPELADLHTLLQGIELADRSAGSL